ncbi:Uncharacterised protein [Mycobacterium tuberculosis]|nr:Uncharacterised protein [Mycobacterium tuberculosis]
MACHEGAKFSCERFNTLFQRFALIGERDFTAVAVDCLCNAPGDGAVVGHAHDETAFACHEA